MGKAALLLPDESGKRFVPWVYRGIDRTTQHHLRLPKEFLEALPGLEEGSSAGVEGDSLAPLESYFSSREFALIKRLVLCPFVGGGQISALLLLIDSEDLPLETTVDVGSIEAAGPAIAARINSARSILGGGTTAKRSTALRSRLASIFTRAETAGLHVIAAQLDLDRLAHDLMRDVTTADLYRFKRDLAGALTTMVSGSGELMSLGARHVLLVIQSKNPYSVRLLAHQFTQGIRSLVGDPPPLDNPAERTWRYPDGGKSVDEVIDSILEQ